MEIDLLNYLPIDEKIKKARSLMKSALVYNHVYFMMTDQTREQSHFSGAVNEEAMNKRYEFDRTRDISMCLRDSFQTSDRLRNYKNICKNEVLSIQELLKDKTVRMNIIQDVMKEEQMDLQQDFSFCDLSVCYHLDKFKPRQKIKTLFVRGIRKMRKSFNER